MMTRPRETTAFTVSNPKKSPARAFIESTVSSVSTAMIVHVGSAVENRGVPAGTDASGPAAAAVTVSAMHATKSPIDRTTSSCARPAASTSIRRRPKRPFHRLPKRPEGDDERPRGMT
jgi:hypothetical protein